MFPIHFRTFGATGLHRAIQPPFAASWNHVVYIKPSRHPLEAFPKYDTGSRSEGTLIELRSPQIRMAQIPAYPEPPVDPNNAHALNTQGVAVIRDGFLVR